jgi:hypothetical protein
MALDIQRPAFNLVAAFCVSAVILMSSLASHAAPRGEDHTTPDAKARAAAAFARLPLSFEPVSAGGEAFVSRGMGYSLALTRSAMELKLKSANAVPATFSMEIAGANPEAKLSGERKLAGTANYFVGNDPAKWRRNVPTYGAVHYSNVYRGIDLVFYGNRGQVEYDFVVGANADPAQIRMHFDGTDALAVTQSGDLAVGAGQSQITFHKPVVYQLAGGRQRGVAGRFALLDAHTAGFELGSYDRTRPLVIDPTLVYGTYIGGSGLPGDQGYGIAVDKNGSAYVTGEAESTDFPFTETLTLGNPPNPGSAHIFVAKFNAAGTALVYSTYIGGTYDDKARAIAVDSNNCAYVTGTSFSYDYPATVGAFMTSNPSPQIGAPFVSKLTPAGDGVVYSTFLGGSGLNGFGDEANAIVVDANLNAYVAGKAFSADFPVTQGAYQTANNAKNGSIPGSNAFLTKLSWDGKGMVYSTYVGGSGAKNGLVGDEAAAVAVDGSGNAYIAGYTYSSNFPITASAFQKTNKGYAKGNYNAFVTKVKPDGTALVYSTLLGGTGIANAGDRAYGLAVDHSGDAFVTGAAFSTDFPVTAGAVQTQNAAGNNASTNAFITKLDPAGSGLIYSTFLGGIGLNKETGDFATSIGLDGNGNAYIAGSAYSANFPVTANALQKTNRAAYHGEQNPFIAQLNAAGNGLLFSSYLGGSGADVENAMTTDGAGNVYITGKAYSTDFPVTKGAYQTANLAEVGVNAGTNAFVAKVSIGTVASTTATTTTLVSSANPAAPGATVTFTATVNAKTGTAVPMGAVVFSVDGVSKGTINLVSRVAKYSTASLAVGTHTIKVAYAGNTSFSASSATLTETIKKPVAAAPKFSPVAGLYAPNTIVKLTSTTAGAAIYYTTNGSAPTTAAPRYTTAGIKVAKSETIKAIAVAAGYSNSPAASAAYIIKPAAPKPVFHPGTESFTTSVTVKLTDAATTGLTIYYTTNGAVPTTASTKYTSAGIKVTKTETIKAMAIATGYSKSAVVSTTYKLK